MRTYQLFETERPLGNEKSAKTRGNLYTTCKMVEVSETKTTRKAFSVSVVMTTDFILECVRTVKGSRLQGF